MFSLVGYCFIPKSVGKLDSVQKVGLEDKFKGLKLPTAHQNHHQQTNLFVMYAMGL
jgi:hypothetical protein